MEIEHVPVLVQEVLSYLDPLPGQKIVDATVGSGGHALVILKKLTIKGSLVGFEWDEDIINSLESKIKQEKIKNFILINDSYTNMLKHIKEINFFPVDAVIFDFGMSSFHIDTSGRGFTFKKNEPLDMRYNKKNDKTAASLLNSLPEDELADILFQFGEEHYSRLIAKAIVKHRKIKRIITSRQLVAIIEEVVPVSYRNQKIHCATRTFQALRIAVNDELINVKIGLEQAYASLRSGGKIAAISFHSLEDRIVKQFFNDLYQQDLADKITKKPVIASEEEISKNPRARSAKLRIISKK